MNPMKSLIPSKKGHFLLALQSLQDPGQSITPVQNPSSKLCNLQRTCTVLDAWDTKVWWVRWYMLHTVNSASWRGKERRAKNDIRSPCGPSCQEKIITYPHTHGHQLFSRGGEECLKKWSTPQNGSRGGVKFGVTEGGKGGGTKEKFLHN